MAGVATNDGAGTAAFFAIWLLGAAAAALYTRVVRAFIAQGFLGLLLLAAYIWA